MRPLGVDAARAIMADSRFSEEREILAAWYQEELRGTRVQMEDPAVPHFSQGRVRSEPPETEVVHLEAIRISSSAAQSAQTNFLKQRSPTVFD